ncbi:dihydrofolate reductase family protein [Chitinophaga solisilvae]|uniref:dihydrofolate reductase family protein n=1 Tax=Chitinophaga solisilvae TaxID=1233460 RepID=UPI001367ECC9|nr:dihydrofolate reductase family protein [Chitinophaga solisilvae]
MRKLILQMQMSIDGFVSAGPADDQQWITWAWEEIRPQVSALLEGSDTILIGRKLAEDYIPYWMDVATQPDHEMYETGLRIAAARKVVFTKTYAASIWENTALATGDLTEEVNRLKQHPGKDLIVYGGTSFVAALIKAGLIDEFNLFVNPVALGHGDPVFHLLNRHLSLKLKNSIAYNSGIVLLQYGSI